jgi:hypothetical protein
VYRNISLKFGISIFRHLSKVSTQKHAVTVGYVILAISRLLNGNLFAGCTVFTYTIKYRHHAHRRSVDTHTHIEKDNNGGKGGLSEKNNAMVKQ